MHNSMENTKVQKSAVTLIIGDSISQRLIEDKLGKGTKSIVNLSKGGAKIVHVQKQIQEFHDKFGSSKNVEKLFVCVGTNDIRAGTAEMEFNISDLTLKDSPLK